MLAHDSRIQPPPLESYSDMPLFNTKAVVHQTGVPAPTLRAWERRYGILAPRRGENDYRLYSERDMAIISWLRERVESGLTISQAIALLHSLEPMRRRTRRARPGIALPHEAPGVDATHEPLAHGLREAAPVRSGGLSLDELSATLLQQLIALDESAANSTIAQAFAIYSLEDVCLSLFAPTLERIGQLWSSGELTVTTEHFASALIRGRLESLFNSAATSDDAPLALVGCAPGELHEIGALMLALFLRRAGLRVIYLGQSIELEHFITTIESIRPACVLLSAAMRPQAEALIEIGRRLGALGQRRPTFFFGGQAFRAEPDLAKRVHGSYLELEAPAAAHEIKHRLTA
ncbi:MAG TPA: cobalamin-dependent protein [Ktedonobacterales bacterium]|jgi:methanogenic corrinoid protein MtbC1|nr:cobalamin-dependent protein [Ktedonobacterales bacterium]